MTVLRKKITVAPVESVIRVLRGQKVVLDGDLAELYGVKPIALRQQVKRNHERFPDDFMFRLTEAEVDILVSQFVIPSKSHLGGYLPYAFTQEGVAMLSSVLRSPRAVAVNIVIMRGFVRLRELVATHKDIADRVAGLEQSCERTASVIEILIEDIDRLSRDMDWIKNPPVQKKHRIGFYIGGEDKDK